MMPPVSLPWKGGTVSARAGAHRQHSAHRNQARCPNHSHRKLHFAGDTPFAGRHLSAGRHLAGYAKADPGFAARTRPTLVRIRRHGKNGRCFGVELSAGVAALHLTLPGLPGTVRVSDHAADYPMRDLFISIKKSGLGVALGVVLGLFAFGQAAEAANPLELNFWLSGPHYDGRMAPVAKPRYRPLPRNSTKKRALTGIPSLTDHRLWRGSMKSRSGHGSPTTSRAAIAAAT